MTTLADVNAKVDAISAAVVAERQEVLQTIADSKAKIQALIDQVNGGDVITQTDLDALGVKLDAVVVAVGGIVMPSDTSQ